MNSRLASLLRGILFGFASGGAAFAIVFFGGSFPLKFHAWLLAALTVLFAISDFHYSNLLSELSALLRRGTFSVWQLEQLDQTVPAMRKRIAFVWSFVTWLKALVGLVCAFLLGDDLPHQYQSLMLFCGYACLFCSILYGIWAQRNFRKLEREVDALNVKEATAKEKRRLLRELQSGAPHEFKNDELANGYTNPPAPV